jgi:hypothetical protein
MSLLTALAISIGGLGGVATWIYLGWLTGLQIWATFIAWACFYHCGGKEAGLKNTIVCNIAGAVLAWIALLLVTQTGVGAAISVPLWAGICVGVTVAVMVLLANVPAFATIPAMVYGYASVAAFFLLSGANANVTAADFTNPLVAVVVSMVIGAVLGYVSEKIGVALSSSASRATA